MAVVVQRRIIVERARQHLAIPNSSRTSDLSLGEYDLSMIRSAAHTIMFWLQWCVDCFY